MATLKDHQQAMVDLLASGTGIPASASRLAHAMHDVLEILLNDLEIERCGSVIDRLIIEPANPTPALKELMNRRKETTPGLNDKALAADVEACRPKTTPAARRVKELENTCGQLRNNLRAERAKVEELETAVSLLQKEILDSRGLSND